LDGEWGKIRKTWLLIIAYGKGGFKYFAAFCAKGG